MRKNDFELLGEVIRRAFQDKIVHDEMTRGDIWEAAGRDHEFADVWHLVFHYISDDDTRSTHIEVEESYRDNIMREYREIEITPDDSPPKEKPASGFSRIFKWFR